MRHRDVSQTLRCDGWIFQPVNIAYAGGYIFSSKDNSSRSRWMSSSVSRANHIVRRRGSEYSQTLRNTQISRVSVPSTDQKPESTTTHPRAKRDQWMKTKQAGWDRYEGSVLYVMYSSVAHCKANYIFSLKCQICNSVTLGFSQRCWVKCRDHKEVFSRLSNFLHC